MSDYGAKEKPKNYGRPWNRDELILAFELYCRIPFSKTKANNPKVVKLAKILERSPAGVARKLGNFGAFDPELQKRNISGLTHGSKLDQWVWEEFQSDWNGLVMAAWKLRKSFASSEGPFSSIKPCDSQEVKKPTGPSEREIITKARVHQTFFRQTILSSYENTCCITGLTISSCLIASHIAPWSEFDHFRTDPSNGLCLSATFDRAFDSGLITVSEDYRVIVCKEFLKTAGPRNREIIGIYNERPIMLPKRFAPSQDRLRWHRENIFQKKIRELMRNSH